jgi:MFS transporter, ACS family, tartrate transporter
MLGEINMDLAIESRTIKKVAIRIVPFMFIAYLVSFLDRVSITYASLGGMDKALQLTSSTFGLLAGLFFITYFLSEIPSNIFFNRFGARKWIARILVSWGIVTFITAWVNSAGSLAVCRLLLGMAEAGFFPGMILYVCYWFPNKQRAKYIALFMTAPPIANALGSPAATWIVQHDWMGFAGWRWVFILAGIPAIILGILTFFYLPDGPRQAKFLHTDEKTWLISQLEKEQNEKLILHPVAAHKGKVPVKGAFKNKIIWQFAIANLVWSSGLYGITFWMPRIIKTLSSVLTPTAIGWVTMVPFLFGAVVMTLIARSSDRSGERRLHAAIPQLLGALALIGAVLSPSPLLAIGMMCIATGCLYSWSGPYWAMASSMITAEIAVVGTGVINCFGSLGGFVGPYAIGVIKDTTGTLMSSVVFLAVCLALASIIIFWISSHTKTGRDSSKTGRISALS